MDFTSAVLSFYLLFPNLYASQEWFKAVLPVPQIFVSEQRSEESVEEKIKSVQNFLFATDDAIPEDFFSEENAANVSEEEKPVSERLYLDSENKMRLFEYGEEKFIPLASYTKEGEPSLGQSLVSVNSDCVTRVEFDSDYLPKEKLVWKNASTEKDSVLLSKTSWTYSELGESVVTEENFAAGTVVVSEKDAAGLVAKRSFYSVKKDPLSTENNPLPDIKILESSVSMTWDSEKRILSEEEILYSAEEENKNDSGFVRKKVFSYTGISQTPDMRFYENGKLRLVSRYLDDKTCIETMYFDGGFTVIARYENGIRTDEKITSPGFEEGR